MAGYVKHYRGRDTACLPLCYVDLGQQSVWCECMYGQVGGTVLSSFVIWCGGGVGWCLWAYKVANGWLAAACNALANRASCRENNKPRPENYKTTQLAHHASVINSPIGSKRWFGS